MARCKFCGQEIDWITSMEGKQVPVDPDPVFVIEDGGPEAFLDDMGATITGRQAPFEGHSKKPDETRRRIVELLGDVPRIELFARQRADGWDTWGNEAPEE